MGLDTSATKAIFFITAVVVAATLAGIFTTVTYKFSSNIGVRAQLLSSTLKSDIKIINDPAAVPYNNTTHLLILYVKNTGKTLISTAEVTVLIDGMVVPSSNVTIEVLTSTGQWYPGSVAQINVTVALSPGDHVAKVVLSNGVYDEFEFRIP